MADVEESRQRADFDAGELISLLGEQCDICVNLLLLAERQRSLILDKDSNRLLVLLAERQKLLDRFSVLSRRLGPYQQNWPAVKSSLSAEQSVQVGRLLYEVNDNLSAVLAGDEKDARLLLAGKVGSFAGPGKSKDSGRIGAAYSAADGG